jgi:hypothetical protein
MGSLATNAGYSALRKSYGNFEQFIIACVDVVNNILKGKLNNTGQFTVTANATTTTITDSRIGANSVICVMPTTATAATELATLYFGTFAEGSCVANHSNDAATDRVFKYTVTG